MTRQEEILEEAKKRFGYDKPFSMSDFLRDGACRRNMSQILYSLKNKGAFLIVGEKAKGKEQSKYLCNKDYVPVISATNAKLTKSQISSRSHAKAREQESKNQEVGLRLQEWLNFGLMA